MKAKRPVLGQVVFNKKVPPALMELVQSWGGDIRYAGWDEELPGRTEGAPFSAWLAIDYDNKLVYVRGPLDLEELGGLIHECAHVFACHEHPRAAAEYDFLGWEFIVARKVDLLPAWLASMTHYVIVHDAETGMEATFDELSVDEQSDALEERVAFAIEQGLLTPDGEPLSIRRGVQ